MSSPVTEAMTIGQMLEAVTAAYKKKDAFRVSGRTITYQELDKNANRVANGLAGLGIEPGDRVAIMLPNIPEFVYTFFGIQKLGGTAVPFNTTYKGREITHILNDSGARAIVTLASSVNLINEIREDTPALEHVIITGQRTLVFLTPEATANVQFVVDKHTFGSGEEAFRAAGELLVDTLHELGAEDAWYKHRGSVRARGRKLATILVSEIENLYVVNCVVFLAPLKTDDFFKVVWVTPEVKDKVVEPMISVEELTGTRPTLEAFRDAVQMKLAARFGSPVEAGELKRDEILGYEKARALSYRRV